FIELKNRANNILHGNINHEFRNGLSQVPGNFAAGLGEIKGRAVGLAQGNINPEFTAGVNNITSSASNIAQGNFNPDMAAGVKVIMEGRALEVGAEVLKQAPSAEENLLPVYGAFRRMTHSYNEGDAEGVLANGLQMVTDLFGLRRLTEEPAAKPTV